MLQGCGLGSTSDMNQLHSRDLAQLLSVVKTGMTGACSQTLCGQYSENKRPGVPSPALSPSSWLTVYAAKVQQMIRCSSGSAG